MCVGLHVKYPLFLSDFNETWTLWADFQKIFRYLILWISLSGSRVVPWGWAEGLTDGRTDMTNLIAAFRNFGNAPKNRYWLHKTLLLCSFPSYYKFITADTLKCQIYYLVHLFFVWHIINNLSLPATWPIRLPFQLNCFPYVVSLIRDSCSTHFKVPNLVFLTALGER